MSYMKKVTLRAFKQDSRYQRMAHDGHPVLVTNRGQPYFSRIATREDRHVSMARLAWRACRGEGKPLTADLLDSVRTESEWHSAR